MPHIRSDALRPISPFRKIASAAWSHPNSGQVFAEISIPIQKTIDALEHFNTHSSLKKATLTHVMGYCLAKGFEKHPTLNRFVSWKGFRQRKTIDIFITTLLKKKPIDLSGIQLKDADRMTFKDFVKTAQHQHDRLVTGRDHEVRRVNTLLNKLPLYITTPIIKLLQRLLYGMNISGQSMGLPGDRFGSAILTPLAPFGLDHAAIPLFPFSKTPYIFGIGQAKHYWHPKHPDGVLKLPVYITADHRVVDGYEGGRFLKTLQKLLASPENWLHYDKMETV